MDKSLGNTFTYSKRNSLAPPVSNIEGPLNVYIWDMDETLILLKSLLDGTYGIAIGSKDVQKGMEIGKHWENRILQVCDEIFFYEQVRFILISLVLVFIFLGLLWVYLEFC